ncbi:branched-chain amino acid ABC transporter substrate-binding protein [Burkholderia sp. Ac-20353]|uniref:branched-chain amino acid ABC transporter substrate-binding protein n=1 Tax=Burkholderia sp. Ac-20353 TaxID=2703894 RepID=UPI001F11B53B|nr:branched-chain amino acid ABC transporter substrate-binding protein [Burkholderia sp. Ac-20353]
MVTVCAGIAHADDTVKIGVAAPLTGQAAYQGKDLQNGAQLAVDQINAAGLLIRGQKVKLVLDAEDDAGDPRQATQVAQKLTDAKIVAVIGHLNSGTTIPASKIYSDAGIVQIAPTATNPAYTQQGFKTTYRLVATDARQGPSLADYASKVLKIKTVAIVDDATAYGQGLAVEFEKGAKANGIKVVSHDATNDKATDFRAILTKIKGERPDAIMFGGLDAAGGPFAKQARQLGMPMKILAGDGVCISDLAKLAGDAASNVICSIAGAPLEKMPKGPSFAQSYKARFGNAPVLAAPFTYDAVYVIADAMKRAQSTAPDKILAAMPSTNYQGVLGDIRFDSRGDLRQGVISLYKYVDGKQMLLDTVKY